MKRTKRGGWVLGLAWGLGLLSAGPALAFGAVAFSDDTDYGVVTYNFESHQAAARAALNDCRAGDCQVVAQFEDECAALAVGSDGFGWATGERLGEAQLEALFNCRQVSSGCELLTSACDRR